MNEKHQSMIAKIMCLPTYESNMLLKMESAFISLVKVSDKTNEELTKIIDKLCMEYSVKTMDGRIGIIQYLYNQVLSGEEIQ